MLRLDGLDISAAQQSIGYLPQAAELLPGTIAENIARFTDAAPEDIQSAAKLAGAHEVIKSLPQGYDTEVSDAGNCAGWRHGAADRAGQGNLWAARCCWCWMNP